MQIELSKRITGNQSSGYAKFMALKEKAKSMSDIIDFTIGDPKEPVDPRVLNSIQEFANQRATSGYPLYTGEKNFKEACASYMQREHNTSLNLEKEICITAGSKDAINYFALSIINEGDLAICPNPCYPPCLSSIRDIGGEIYLVNLKEKDNFLLDFRSIPEETAKKAKIIWINYPNSPTGAIAPLEYYKELVKWAEKYNIIIASDEGCYIDLTYKDKLKAPSIFEAKPNKEGIIAFYSLSKRNNMTGYRLGFVCGDEKLISVYKTIQNRRSGGVSAFIQDAGVVALQDNTFTDQMIELYDKKKRIILEALNRIGLQTREPETAFYIWQKVPDSIDGLKFAEILLNIGIMVSPGEFLAEDNNGDNPGKNYVRFALVPKMEKVIEASEKIKKLNFRG
jgi:LL-diaminopimelate aminotransferase